MPRHALESLPIMSGSQGDNESMRLCARAGLVVLWTVLAGPAVAQSTTEDGIGAMLSIDADGWPC
jgi:hypothetical protein